jgi:hypothetical protein
MDITEIFLRSVKDVLSWKVMRITLMVSVPLIFLLLVVGSLLWDGLISLSISFIDWIPLSILKSNLAFILGGFLWFQTVIVTYALIFAIGNVAIFKYMDQKKYEYFSIVTILLVALFWTLFMFFNWDMVFSEVKRMLTWFPIETLERGSAFLLVVTGLYNFFIVSLVLVLLMVRKPFLEEIQQNDYPYEVLQENRIDFSKVLVRDIALFFGLQIVLFPLFFLPFINVIVQLFLWAWLIKESYFLAAASLYATQENITLYKKQKFTMWGIALIGSMLNFVPLVNILSPFFTLLLYFHWIMQKRYYNWNNVKIK